MSDHATVWQPLPRHPRAGLAMALGIIAVAGALLGLPLLLAPLAWYQGISTMRAIDREPHRWGGRGMAQAGLILGVIGTILLVIVLMLATLIVVGIVVINGLDIGYGT